jgi:transposase
MAFWYAVWMSSSHSTRTVRVLRLRVKDKHATWLCSLAREVTTVFNYCNELSVKVFECERRFRVAAERNKPSAGSILDRSVASLGIDLGLSTFAAFSDEALPPLEAERFYRDLEPLLARAQRMLDAGWSAFRIMLLYKCDDAGVWFDEVDEAFSTQTCSRCNNRAGPKGRKDLGIRGWQCSVCEAVHDRNVNAAHNILAAGHRRRAEGILGP